MLKVLVAFICGLIVIPICVYFYFSLGIAPVATAAQAMPFEKKLAHIALNARVDKEAPKNSPLQPSDDNYQSGADVYRQHCAVCHGLPGQELSDIGKGEFPKPPHLFKGKGVTDDPAGETYWKVANGIRLTGMPAFKNALTDTQMWQVSLLLANGDKLPAAVHQKLEQPLKTE